MDMSRFRAVCMPYAVCRKLCPVSCILYVASVSVPSLNVSLPYYNEGRPRCSPWKQCMVPEASRRVACKNPSTLQRSIRGLWRRDRLLLLSRTLLHLPWLVRLPYRQFRISSPVTAYIRQYTNTVIVSVNLGMFRRLYVQYIVLESSRLGHL